MNNSDPSMNLDRGDGVWRDDIEPARLQPDGANSRAQQCARGVGAGEVKSKSTRQ